MEISAVAIKATERFAYLIDKKRDRVESIISLDTAWVNVIYMTTFNKPWTHLELDGPWTTAV